MHLKVNKYQSATAFCFASTFVFALVMATLGVSAGAQPSEYSEAPQLAQLAEAGQLPPVNERLPENPVVVEPVERIGQYGGIWRTALVGGADILWLERTIGYENLVRWDPEWTEIISNIAESYEANEESTAFTFRLRQGMKWSDGHPFTADDVMFWYEDVLMNEELTPVAPSWLVSGGEPVVVEKLDDITVVFSFAEPNGFFLQFLAGGSGAPPTDFPRHYLEQFHAKYNPEGIDALVREAGLEDWASLFQNQANVWQNKERPTLFGWIVTTAYGESTRVVAERNPYYWKTDPDGNQLPYLDQVVYDLFEDAQVLLLRILSGEIDMHARHFNTLDNRAVVFDYMERGNYHLVDFVTSDMNSALIAFNMTHQDPIKREIFQNKDFRIGLSHAINREEIIDLIFIGQGEPWQAAPRAESAFYHERLAKQYTEYDVELANEYLDRAGYTERDAQGFRLGPDGNRISFGIDSQPLFNWVDILELVQMYWEEVGIDVQINTMDRSLYDVRREGNQHDANVNFGGAGLQDAILAPFAYLPYNVGSHFAIAWAHWYNNDPRGEEPPAAPKRQMELYSQLAATADPAQQAELMREILDIAAEEFYHMGIGLRPQTYGIVKNNFQNVPDAMFSSGGAFMEPATTNPVQYFIADEE
jgi:peptide/nickel transport system substrate-binding protein